MKQLRRLWWGTIILALVVVGGLFAFSAAGHVRAWDSGFRPLAETALEGYCSGLAYTPASRFDGAERRAADCRADEANADRPNDYNIAVVMSHWCDGIVAAEWNISTSDCLVVVNENALWALYDGGFTNDWRTVDRPDAVGSGYIGPPGRGGSRDGSTSRGDLGGVPPATEGGTE